MGCNRGIDRAGHDEPKPLPARLVMDPTGNSGDSPSGGHDPSIFKLHGKTRLDPANLGSTSVTLPLSTPFLSCVAGNAHSIASIAVQDYTLPKISLILPVIRLIHKLT
jgi:hypothetical protein